MELRVNPLSTALSFPSARVVLVAPPRAAGPSRRYALPLATYPLMMFPLVPGRGGGTTGCSGFLGWVPLILNPYRVPFTRYG